MKGLLGLYRPFSDKHNARKAVERILCLPVELFSPMRSGSDGRKKWKKQPSEGIFMISREAENFSASVSLLASKRCMICLGQGILKPGACLGITFCNA